MNPILRNVLAVIAGVIIGGTINYGIILLTASLGILPEGVNIKDPESLGANIHLFKVQHFIGPLLAHAIGTLVGAYAAARLSASHGMKWALLIGLFFLAGGLQMSMTIAAPFWFEATDLLLAYLPMAFLGGKIGLGNR